MGLFKKEKGSKEKNFKELPHLPELPKLPELEDYGNSEFYSKSIHQLPKYPNNSAGDKFSQYSIKEAVAGGKEGEGSFEADDFASSSQMMPKAPKKQFVQEIPDISDEDEQEKYTFSTEESPQEVLNESLGASTREIAEIPRFSRKMQKQEPIFIRLDKFEESLDLFKKVKKQISEIETMLKDIKKLKDEEEKELELWEKEMQSIKIQVEKVDRDIFSKVE